MAADLGAAFDLGDRKLGVILAGQDRGLQARFAVGPERELPVVDGALDRGAEFEVLLREDEEIEHLQNTELDIERVEILLLHKRKIRAGRSAGRRPGVAARDQGRGARIGRGADIGRHELVQVGMRVNARMDIAIDDAQPALGGDFLLKNRAVDDVAHAILLLLLSGELQPRKGFKRVVFAHA